MGVICAQVVMKSEKKGENVRVRLREGVFAKMLVEEEVVRVIHKKIRYKRQEGWLCV